MAETLADLPLAERYDCVGRWADVDNEDYLAVIVRTYGEGVTYAQMLAPEVNHYYTAELSAIAPRYELPRAWQPDASPVHGKWEHPSYVNDILADGSVEWALAPCRRWVGKWELPE